MFENFCIISSNCISGFWYRDIIKQEYEIPFIWSIVKLTDMLFLIDNFEKINFNNVKAEMSDGEVNRGDGSKWVKIVLDNCVNVYFVHYRENKNLDGESKITGINVVSSNILKYAEDTWHRRCNRIPYGKKMVWVFWDDKINTNTDLNKFILAAKNRKNDLFVLFTPKAFESKEENLFILPITNYNNVPKHTKDLEKLLKDYEETRVIQ